MLCAIREHDDCVHVIDQQKPQMAAQTSMYSVGSAPQQLQSMLGLRARSGHSCFGSPKPHLDRDDRCLQHLQVRYFLRPRVGLAASPADIRCDSTAAAS